MNSSQYIHNINKRYKQGNATEHTYRGDLQQLIEGLVPEIMVTNEPKRQSCGAPDYILTKKSIPIGFIEAKDIGDKDLEGKNKSINKEQFDRYKKSLGNLIFTDYINFHLYHDGELITKISIAEITEKGIVALPQNFGIFEDLIKDFCTHIGQSIKSSKKLAEMMAGKARLLSDVIEKSVTSDESHGEDSTLKEQMTAFKSVLIHDITPKGFADVYAQTIAYGLFAARLHDPTLETFSRQEAAELIPKSNPFLRKLFGYIAGPDIDDRIKWIVENLSEIFLACNVEEILKNYGKTTKMEDPIIHFYETFLAEYDPKLRKARGVWYTPAPVVNFIVRAVDDILKTEFDLPQGLADTSKTKITVNTQNPDKRSATGYKQTEQEVHKVQILDPATGTGTFLAEVIKHVNKKFKGQEGIWSSYVENDLLPRLNGFELLMASYAMAHLQLDLLLKETGFKATKDQRTRVYLTNSLEEYHPDTGTLFANWLSSEANEANHIKRDTPVMCIIGNPPYSSQSSNKGDWINQLMKPYKLEPGGKIKLKERNPKWLNDDYVKFLRYGQHYIEKNGSGVLAFINPHGYLDNPTFRGMRWHLLKTYDKIYTIDLHGNSNKKEVSPDGSPDKNVFDIKQGVSINIFIKTGNKQVNSLGKVMHYDLYGERDHKYKFLTENSLSSIDFEALNPESPYFFFYKRDTTHKAEYYRGMSLDELFIKKSTGYYTSCDDLVLSEDKDELRKRMTEYTDNNFDESKIYKTNYRPFEDKFIYYDKNILKRSRYNFISNFIGKENSILLLGKSSKSKVLSHFYISNKFTELKCAEYSKGSYMFPLYIYENESSIINPVTRLPNLKLEIINQIAERIGLTFTKEKETTESTFSPIDILDYIYAVLHSPTYREKYKEFIRIDFPKVPYPKDANTFWQLVKLGGEIRQIHLLESPKVEEYITTFPKGGDNTITTKVAKKDWELFDEEKQLGRIWINEDQYFDNIPLTAWEFYIGGYQPAQKWLKDRKERTLEFDDILHYQKIIVALSETDRLMKEIDKIEIE